MRGNPPKAKTSTHPASEREVGSIYHRGFDASFTGPAKSGFHLPQHRQGGGGGLRNPASGFANLQRGDSGREARDRLRGGDFCGRVHPRQGQRGAAGQSAGGDGGSDKLPRGEITGGGCDVGCGDVKDRGQRVAARGLCADQRGTAGNMGGGQWRDNAHNAASVGWDCQREDPRDSCGWRCGAGGGFECQIEVAGSG